MKKKRIKTTENKSKSKVAQDLYIHPSHTYVRIIEDELVEVGMDLFARKSVGKIESFTLPKVGQKMHKGEIAWKAKIGVRILKQQMPVDGIIVEINPSLNTEDWILKVKTNYLKENLPDFIDGSEAVGWFISEKAKFLVNFSSSLVPAMQDKGELVDGFSRYLPDEVWKEFSKAFFH